MSSSLSKSERIKTLVNKTITERFMDFQLQVDQYHRLTKNQQDQTDSAQKKQTQILKTTCDALSKKISEMALQSTKVDETVQVYHKTLENQKSQIMGNRIESNHTISELKKTQSSLNSVDELVFFLPPDNEQLCEKVEKLFRNAKGASLEKESDKGWSLKRFRQHYT